MSASAKRRRKLIRRHIAALECAAREGQQRIADGESFRDDLTDAEFTALVPVSDEEAVIVAMVKSDRWWRTDEGFTLK